MWIGYTESLKVYYNTILLEWIKRGYKNNMPFLSPSNNLLPWWFGNENFHIAHQSNLIRKDPNFYIKIFGETVPNNLPYIWPK